MIEMPTLEEIFDAIEHVKVFSTQDLKSRYHQLPIKEVDKQKITFWGIDEHGKNQFYQWWLLPFRLNNVVVKFQKIMDNILIGLDYAWCYIDDIIIFNATM